MDCANVRPKPSADVLVARWMRIEIIGLRRFSGPSLIVIKMSFYNLWYRSTLRPIIGGSVQ